MRDDPDPRPVRTCPVCGALLDDPLTSWAVHRDRRPPSIRAGHLLQGVVHGRCAISR